jgi:hypothetical protein
MIDASLFTDEQLEQAIRRFQPKAGGRTPSFTVPEAMTDKDRGQKQWELDRLNEEIAVWERPREWSLPDKAQPHMQTGFADEGVLRQDELAARPDAEGWDPGKISPRFARETGIYALPSGEVTNEGKELKARGFEQSDTAKQRYIEAIQKRNQLRQELAQDKAGVANIPGYGIFERGEEGKLGKRIAEAPTAGDWTKTREGATTLALLDKVGEGGKLSKAQEISFRNHHKRLSDQLATVQEPLLTGQIEGEGGINRPLTQEERQYFESQAEGIKGQMQTLESVMGGSGQGVDEAFEVKGGQDGYQEMMPQVTDRLNAIEKAKGREAAERVLGQVQRMIQNKRPPADIEQYLKDAATGVERQGAQREEPQGQPRQEKSPVDEGLMEVNAPAMPRPSRKPMMRPQGGEAGSVSASAARSQAMSTRSPQDIQRNRQRLDEAFGPDRVNQMTSDMDIGNPFTSAQKSMENIGGYFDRATTAVQGRRGRGVVPEDVQADRTAVLTKAEQVSPGAGQKIESALTKVFGGEYFDPNTQTIKPEAIPVLVQVARQLGLSDQQIQQIMGT